MIIIVPKTVNFVLKNFKEFFKKTKKGYLKAISGKIFESKNKE